MNLKIFGSKVMEKNYYKLIVILMINYIIIHKNVLQIMLKLKHNNLVN